LRDGLRGDGFPFLFPFLSKVCVCVWFILQKGKAGKNLLKFILMKRYFITFDDYFAILHYFSEVNVIASPRDTLTLRLARTFNWNVEYILKTEIGGEKPRNKERKDDVDEKKRNNDDRSDRIVEKAMSDVLPRNEGAEKKEVKYHKFTFENFYIWDGTNGVDKAEYLRKQGYCIWGGGLQAGVLEMDRLTAKLFFDRMRIPTAEWEVVEIGGREGAITKLVQKLKNYGSKDVVLKVANNLFPTTICYGDEMAEIVEENADIIEKAPYVIIELKKEGREISCERYLTGVARLYNSSLTNFTIEAKYFLSGDYGIQTGGEFNLVFPSSEIENFALWTKSPTKTVRVLEKIKEELEKTVMLLDVEILDINFIVDVENEKYWALECTPRIGYPGTITFAHLLWNNGICWDEAVSSPDDFIVRGFAFGVRVSVPPYPYERKKKKEEEEKEDEKSKEFDFIDTEIIVEDWEEEGGKVKFACDGIYEEDGKLWIMNTNLGVVNSYSREIKESLFSNAYKFIKDRIDGVIQVRTDGCEWFREKWIKVI